MKSLLKILTVLLPFLLLFLIWVYLQNNYHSFSSTAVIAPATSTVIVIIGGDVMLDRRDRYIGETSGYDSLFAGIAPLAHQADIAVTNLEGSITTYPSKTLLSNGHTTGDFAFTFATTTASALSRAGFTAVSLANNHSGNFGQIGLDQTHAWLESAGMKWFGDPYNVGAGTSSTAAVICRKSICLAFVGYDEFEPGFEGILADVRRLSNEGYPVIVMPHWGDEYASVSPERVKEKARELAAAGAFAIVGAHPHVIEDREWIGDVPVIYSLGNLVFDQYFSPEVMTGSVAELDIEVAPAKSARIIAIRLYAVSNESHKGPVIVGGPVEFPKPTSL